MSVHLSYKSEIRSHARAGLGWEDVLVVMKLSRAHTDMVRRIVLGSLAEPPDAREKGRAVVASAARPTLQE